MKKLLLLLIFLPTVCFSGITSATGGTKTEVNGDTVHTFTSSGTFSVTGSGNVIVLVVAGGGGGGRYYGGGGGGGGLVYDTLSVTTQAYPVTIGAGGAEAPNKSDGSPGENSVFSTITANGGGYGGGNKDSPRAGGDGGSGGGAGGEKGAASGGTASQGYDGGDANNAGGAGGGGAGEIGENSYNSAGDGGNGLEYSISGSAVTYAGGGGGSWTVLGSGGAGGGGAGASQEVPAQDGTANRGGGGGGGSNPQVAGAGGSGIVIVRWTPGETFGKTSIGGTHSDPVTRYCATKAILTENGTITSMSMYLSGASGTIYLGIYDNTNEVVPEPDSRLVYGSGTATNGWCKINMSKSLTAGTYWLAFWTSSEWYYDAGGKNCYSLPDQSGLPATFAVSGCFEFTYSIFATYDVAVPAGQVIIIQMDR